MMSQTQAAPNLKKQPTGASQCRLFIGSQAWDFANLPTAERTPEEIAMAEVLPTAKQAPPIVLDDKVLKNLTAYRLAPPTVEHVELYRCNHGEALSGSILSELCLWLAKNTKAATVAMFDEAGELIENLSDYTHRLRNDKDEQALAEMAILSTQKAAKTAQSETQAKRSPYIEKRIENGASGLFRVIPKVDKETGEIINEKTEWLSDEIAVLGIGRSETEEFLILQFTPEQCEQPTTEALPLAALGEREGWQLLRRKGLRVTTSTSKRCELADYLQRAERQSRQLWTITNSTGWQYGAYILPNGEVIGEPEKAILFKSQSAAFGGYNAAGTLESWQREIAVNVNKNSSMMLGIAAALAAPLIGLLDAESFGVHLFGGSTAGKTTTANVASSVWGNSEATRLSWNATALGLTNEAAARCDCFLPLDEIGQGSNRKHVEQTAYTLFNGVGKIQGQQQGGNRELTRWRIVAFSTGEIDLENYLNAGGIKTNAGQLVRLLNIPITPASHFYQFKDGKAHADHLNQAAKTHYGVIGRLWIEFLIANKESVKPTYEAIKAKWLDRLPKDAAAQVQRVASRFAILETALKLASHLTQWSEETSNEALIHCFNEWVNIHGLHSQEERQILNQVNGWLETNQHRFLIVPSDNPNHTPPNMAGFHILADIGKGTEERFFVFKGVYLEDVIKGFNERQANEILATAGMLKTSKEAGYKFLTRMPKALTNGKTKRAYLLAMLDESDDQADGESESQG